LGDVTAATASTITDINSKIFIAEPTYYDGTSVTTSVPTTYFNISCVGGTGTNSITIGKAVGSDAGRSGWSIVGNSSYGVNLDFDDGNVNTSEWYGCSFEDLTGTLSWGTNTNHKLFSSTFTGCSQFDPVGGVALRNNLFVNTADTAGALLWNNSINIQNCKFIANTTGAGVEHDTWNGTVSGSAENTGSETTTLTDTGAFASGVAVNDVVYNETDLSYATISSIDSNDQITHAALTGGTNNFWTLNDVYSITTPYTYTDLTFSGNTNDVDNTTSPANAVAISKTGTSDPSTYPAGDFVAIQGAVTFTVKRVTYNARCRIESTDGATVYLSAYATTTDPDNTGFYKASASVNDPGAASFNVIVRQVGYLPYEAVASKGSGEDLSVTPVWQSDTISDKVDITA